MEKINRETAELEFERFADSMCIDIKEARITDAAIANSNDVDLAESATDFRKNKEVIVKAIMLGNLVINDSGEPVYTPVRVSDKDIEKGRGKPITFYEPTGLVLAATDRRGEKELMAKLFETMGAMTHTHSVKFINMKMYDLKVCQAIAILFLA